jgi:hypothetical protein
MADKEQFDQGLKIVSFALSFKKDDLTSEVIRETVKEYNTVLSGTFQFQEGDFDLLIQRLEELFATTMGQGISLINLEYKHDEEWYKHQDQWEYWGDYQQILYKKGWPSRVIHSMDTVTNNILGLLHDPMQDGEWERRGLVIGHVQSGKTANYIGLVTKAADAGYKFIIVIAGIHNSLRTQTQERIDEGFLGRDSRTKALIGVGTVRPNRITPLTVTTTESDFNKTVAKRFTMELKSLNNTFILVIKKNVSTLSSLYNWLKELNTRKGLEKISDIPMLLIDDEADNASINTNKDDINPTRTNREIRNILNLFRKRCYVGYTATPFANIFIDPDNDHSKYGRDLFPEHFIYSLDAPSNYFGYEKIFLDKEDKEDQEGDKDIKKYVRYVADIEKVIPSNHKKDFNINELPASLNQAIRLFILSRAIRNIRGQQNQHASMLINVSRFVSVQRNLKFAVSYYLNRVQREIRYSYRLSSAHKDPTILEFYQDFQDEYSNTDTNWIDVLNALDEAAQSIEILEINSGSDQLLDYATYTKSGESRSVIAIGGLSLSRGLTLEGLTISYFYRNSKMYDTLLQMGRWFGYREGYDDLCRIYMSKDAFNWYEHIAEATDELRDQIKQMRREKKKPSDFGLYVKAHPDTLIVTALNKMKATEEREFDISYDNKLIETYILPKSFVKTDRNRALLKSSFAELSSTGIKPEQDGTGSYLFKNVSWEQVYNYVLQFQFHEQLSDKHENAYKFIQEISDLYPTWDIAYRSRKDQQVADGFMIAAQERTVGYSNPDIIKQPALEDGWFVGDKNRFSGNNMFAIGLSQSQKDEAEKRAKDTNRKSPIFSDFTNARGRPLLLFHLIKLIDKNKDMIVDLLPAISISFPHSSVFRTVKYTVNKVWLKQFEAEIYDNIAEEDDYDRV